MKPTTVQECANTVVEQSGAESKTPAASAELAIAAAKPARLQLSSRAIIAVTILIISVMTISFVAIRTLRASPASPPVAEARSTADANSLTLDASQMQSIKLATATIQMFRAEKVATGKIAFNEEFLTPVFSPYTG